MYTKTTRRELKKKLNEVSFFFSYFFRQFSYAPGFVLIIHVNDTTACLPNKIPLHNSHNSSHILSVFWDNDNRFVSSERQTGKLGNVFYSYM